MSTCAHVTDNTPVRPTDVTPGRSSGRRSAPPRADSSAGRRGLTDLGDVAPSFHPGEILNLRSNESHGGCLKDEIDRRRERERESERKKDGTERHAATSLRRGVSPPVDDAASDRGKLIHRSLVNAA